MTNRSARLALIVLSIACFLGLSQGATAGTVVADSGFRVEPNGFSFSNYGGDEGYKNLNGAQMRRIFGNVVCLTGRGADCVLSPSARHWMDQLNEAMNGGHCAGFAVLSQLIQRGQLPRFGFESVNAFGGGPFAFDLSIANNVKLQRAIARAVTFQVLPSVIKKTIKGTPAKIVESLRTSLTPENPETYSLIIFQPGLQNGHVMTPYQLEDLGGGKYLIHVYDNNWPGDATRAIEVDTVADSWSYLAATNPNVPGSLYEGDASTATIRLIPTLPGLGTQDCSFCVGRQGGRSKYNEITVSAAGHESARLLITDRKGRKTGFVNGKLVNRIPGAQVVPRASGGPEIAADGSVENLADTLEPLYRVPKDLDLRILVDGRKLTRADLESVSVVGPTFDSTVENIKIGPGQVARLKLSPKERTLSYTGTKTRSTPTVTFGAQSKTAAYRIRVTTPGAPPKGNVFFAKKPNYGLLRIGSNSKRSQRYRVQITRYDEDGVANFARSYALGGRQQGYLFYGPLASPGGQARIAIGEPGKKKVKVLKLKELAPPKQ